MWKKMSSSNWSPWATGIILAFLFLISLYLLDEPVGTTTAYSDLIDNGKDAVNRIVPTINWQVIFLIGVFIGSFIAAIVGKNFKLQLFPEDHLSKGPSFYLTLGPVYSFLGGLFVMAGLILAGNSFLKLWSDCLGLYMTVGLFLIIVFVEAVIIGTMLTIRIEEKNSK
jgi:uncharacterized protein